MKVLSHVIVLCLLCTACGSTSPTSPSPRLPTTAQEILNEIAFSIGVDGSSNLASPGSDAPVIQLSVGSRFGITFGYRNTLPTENLLGGLWFVRDDGKEWFDHCFVQIRPGGFGGVSGMLEVVDPNDPFEIFYPGHTVKASLVVTFGELTTGRGQCPLDMYEADGFTPTGRVNRSAIKAERHIANFVVR